MKGQWYEIVQRFRWTDKSGASGIGLLRVRRKGKKAVGQQVKDNRNWLKEHGHTELSVIITKVDGPDKPMRFS